VAGDKSFLDPKIGSRDEYCCNFSNHHKMSFHIESGIVDLNGRMLAQYKPSQPILDVCLMRKSFCIGILAIHTIGQILEAHSNRECNGQNNRKNILPI
jgi:hypothetical protein